MEIAECSLNGLKTLCEKEKLLVTSNFSFSHSVFKRLVLQTHKNQGLFGKGLKCRLQFVSTWTSLKFVICLPYPKQALVFTCLQYKSFENTVGKGEIAVRRIV